jgi:hypothetical protein
MNRLQRLREYRSRLVNEQFAKVDKFIADGQKAKELFDKGLPFRLDAETYTNYMDKSNARIRLINAEIDRLEETHAFRRPNGTFIPAHA